MSNRKDLVRVEISVDALIDILKDSIVNDGIINNVDYPVAAEVDNNRGIISIICHSKVPMNIGEGGELRSGYHTTRDLKKQ